MMVRFALQELDRFLLKKFTIALPLGINTSCYETYKKSSNNH